ncbi:MAG: PDZ domain-containing protein, partial [bacterium]
GNARGKLKPDDIIIEIDGRSVKFATDAQKLIRKHKIGGKVNITVLRNDNKKKFTIKTVEMQNEPGKASIGILITTENLQFEFPREVNFKTENIIGPSAGGMFALEIYNQLISDDITGGKKIAGTGTISSEGKIGMIDGVKQKVIAAEKVNADIFICPEDNFEKAKKTARKIKVFSVKTFDDIINVLKKNI